MSFDVSGIDPSRGAYRAQPQRAAPGAAASGARFSDTLRTTVAGAQVDTIPVSPPPALREEMMAAQKAFDEMYERGRQLHFEMQDGKLRIQLQDLSGKVLREIPASKALEIAGGSRID